MTAVLLAAAHPVSAGELHQFAGSAFQSFTLEGVTVKSGALSLDTSAAEKVTDADGPAKGRTYYRGTATSRPVAVEGGFREIVLSWNADCPQGSWIVLEARASRKSGWTEWFNMGVWAADDFVVKRTHLAKQNTPEGRVNTDTLVLKDDCSEAQVRISLCSLSSAMIPAVRRLFCDFTPAKPAADADPPSGAPEAVLNVPEISQLSYPPRGGVWSRNTPARIAAPGTSSSSSIEIRAGLMTASRWLSTEWPSSWAQSVTPTIANQVFREKSTISTPATRQPTSRSNAQMP